LRLRQVAAGDDHAVDDGIGRQMAGDGQTELAGAAQAQDGAQGGPP